MKKKKLNLNNESSKNDTLSILIPIFLMLFVVCLLAGMTYLKHKLK
jgi:hypothetical protein